MKTLSSETPESTQMLILIFPQKSMSIIFDNRYVIVLGDFQDDIHLTTDTTIMDRDNGFSMGRDKVFQ